MNTALFQSYLGGSFEALPAVIQNGHAVNGTSRMAGEASVIRGTSLWSRALATAFGFPPAAEKVSVTVSMSAQDGGELWERRFGDKRFRSFLKVTNGVMTERFAPFTFTLRLRVENAELLYPVTAGRLGPIRLPEWLLPLSIAREYESEGKFHFDVELRAPLTGALMVHYQGWLLPDHPNPSA
ncbi:DUF4166 domain-containing protein [Yoonia sp.]|uniref:DUF4166 domain-containing protein n=1 Tax=Yoonia sp. TaxID=2212373 RepID=UPI0035C84D9D